MSIPDNFIFQDLTGKRWSLFKKVIFLSVLIVTILIIVFIKTLFIQPKFNLPENVKEIKSNLKALDNKTNHINSKREWLIFSKKRESYNSSKEINIFFSEIILGFYINWDRRSWKSLENNIHHLTHIACNWFTISLDNNPIKKFPDKELISFLKENNKIFMPILNNLDRDKWMPEAVEDIVHKTDDEILSIISIIINEINELNAGGLIIDFGQINPTYRDRYTHFFSLLSDELKKSNKELWITIPMGLELKAYDLDAISLFVDRFIATLHDENSENDPPGPIASLPWVQGWSETLSQYGRPEQWIIGLGNYAYDWEQGKKARLISFPDAMMRAKKSGLHQIETKGENLEPHFTYESDAKVHNVFFLDAITFLNSFRIAQKYMRGGISIYPLGFEDSGIWKLLPDLLLLDSIDITEINNKLGEINVNDIVANVGDGDLLTFEKSTLNGKREIDLTEKNYFIENYTELPFYYTVIRKGFDPKKIAITFDDGPDAQYTPEILNILKKYNVRATFFVLGKKAEKHPEIIKRIINEGHLIGLHSYTHPNIYEINDERIILELNASERLIQTITNKSTLIFRPPYSDNKPIDYAEFEPFAFVQELGYITISYTIDSKDWEKPGVNKILDNIKNERGEGSVILFHDAGGDRSQTVNALPLVIKYLRDRGDEIVSLDELTGINKNIIMPEIEAKSQDLTIFLAGTGFNAIRLVNEFFWTFVIFSSILVLIRAIVIIYFSSKYKVNFANRNDFNPSITVLISAYNEEKVIEKTLLSVIQSEYKGAMEIIVVDDGSTDNTNQIVSHLLKIYPEIRLITQQNLGKALALKNGLNHAKNNIIVMLDADTQFQKDTLRNLVAPFLDEKVGAVSGHARVGNTKKIISKFQDVEYICGFNLDRRAYHQLNCITVVPGAVCAVRKSAINKCGGITNDTLAEDTDFTLSLHRHGYRIVYSKDGVAWTEAPEDLKSFIKQRLRWGYGTLQCLWKHRDMVFSPQFKALGMFALPAIWFFNIILIALGPIIDIFFILNLANPISPLMLVFFMIFILTDLFLAAYASFLEDRDFKRAFLMIPMRFFYKFILGYVMWKVIIRAIKGIWVGWGKLDRMATVTININHATINNL